jgi:hypothetical protein
MKVMERQVLSKMQKKGITLAKGHNALDAVDTMVATENKENGSTDPSLKKRKKTGERAVLIMPNKKNEKMCRRQQTKKPVMSGPAIKKKTKTPLVGCKYGCRHGGLLDLVQMIPKWMTYHLEKGNYFEDKQCKDCNKTVDDLFGKAKGKGIFYYCQMNNKVADLSFDEQEKETRACACILCLQCYYKRYEKKKSASGRSTRLPGRGRG